MPKKCNQTKARKRTMLAMQRINQLAWLKEKNFVKPSEASQMLMAPLKSVMNWIREKKYIKAEEQS